MWIRSGRESDRSDALCSMMTAQQRQHEDDGGSASDVARGHVAVGDGGESDSDRHHEHSHHVQSVSDHIGEEKEHLQIHPVQLFVLPGSEEIELVERHQTESEQDDARGTGSSDVTAMIEEGGHRIDSTSLPQHTRTPPYYYFLLFICLLAISCAGTLFRLLDETPPLLKAFWRLFFMMFYLIGGFVVQWRQATEETKTLWKSKRIQLLFVIGGLVTAIHFGCWIVSLDYTSLAHSLFFVCAHPLVVVGVMACMEGMRVNKWELVGVVAGLVGSVLMLLDSTTEQKRVTSEGGDRDGGAEQNDTPTANWRGDLLAFIGALAMVAYLYTGRQCRSRIPLFLYSLPVTFFACIPLLVATAIREDVSWTGLHPNSVFGLFGVHAFPIVLGLVLGPGILGHVLIQFLLHRLHPLPISMVITVEPILGVIVGILVGVETIPALYTLLGGPLTLIGCLLAVYGTHVREQEQIAQNQNQSGMELDGEKRQNSTLEALTGAAGAMEKSEQGTSNDDGDTKQIHPASQPSTTNQPDRDDPDPDIDPASDPASCGTTEPCDQDHGSQVTPLLSLSPDTHIRHSSTTNGNNLQALPPASQDENDHHHHRASSSSNSYAHVHAHSTDHDSICICMASDGPIDALSMTSMAMGAGTAAHLAAADRQQVGPPVMAAR